MSSPLLNCKGLKIRPHVKSDLRFLYSCRNDTEFLINCTSRSKLNTLSQYEEELISDFKFDRHNQFIIELNGHSIGTLYSYSYNPDDSFLFVTIYVVELFRKKGYGVISFVLYLNWLIKEFELFKVYCDIYSYNLDSLNLFVKENIAIEGIFKNQKLYKNKRFDVHRFAFYKSDSERLINKFVNKIYS